MYTRNIPSVWPSSDFDYWEVLNDDRATWEQYDTFDEALDAAFPAYAYPGGYPMAYIGDGDIYCADCAKKQYLESQNETYAEKFELSAYVTNEDDGYSGIYCGECSKEIVEQSCFICGDSLYDDKYQSYQYSAGDHSICFKCMVKARHAALCDPYTESDVNRTYHMAYTAGTANAYQVWEISPRYNGEYYQEDKDLGIYTAHMWH